MFKHLLKGALAMLAYRLLHNYRQSARQLLEIEAAKFYVRSVRMVRKAALAAMRLWLVITLMGIGLLLIHISLFILLPWSIETKAVVGLLLGVGYLLLGVLAIRITMSQRKWVAKSGIGDILKDVGAASTTRE